MMVTLVAMTDHLIQVQGVMTPTPVLVLVMLTMTSPCLSQDLFCCQVKVVTGTGELDLDGVYTYNQTNLDRDPVCQDGCVYTREGWEGEEYCFKSVVGGAMIEEQCGGFTTTRRPMMAFTTGSGRKSLELG